MSFDDRVQPSDKNDAILAANKLQGGRCLSHHAIRSFCLLGPAIVVVGRGIGDDRLVGYALRGQGNLRPPRAQ